MRFPGRVGYHRQGLLAARVPRHCRRVVSADRMSFPTYAMRSCARRFIMVRACTVRGNGSGPIPWAVSAGHPSLFNCSIVQSTAFLLPAALTVRLHQGISVLAVFFPRISVQISLKPVNPRPTHISQDAIQRTQTKAIRIDVVSRYGIV